MKRKITIELDEELYEGLKKVSRERRLSMSAFLRCLLLDYLKEKEEKFREK